MQNSPAGQFAPGEQLTDEEVVESTHTEQVHLAQLSPSPSRKRARLSQFQLTDECKCAPDAQLTGDNHATRPDKAQVVEPAYAEQVLVQAEGAAEKTCQACLDQLLPNISRKRIHSLHEDPPAGQFALGEELTDEEVVESAHTEQVHLPQHAEAVARTPMSYKKSKRKKSSKLVKCLSLYEQDISASDERFWSIEHMDLYNNIFSKKQCADNKWIDWKNIRHFPAMSFVEEACRDVGLHELMAIKQNWHEELIKQFYSTLSVNQSRTSLTWMTGINKITVTKRFC
jgi:hypothetical protein